jgi:pyruvate formate lyase activating enzyme
VRRDAHIKMRGAPPQREALKEIGTDGYALKVFDWHGDVRSLHVQAKNTKGEPVKMYIRRRLNDGAHTDWLVHTLAPDESYRTIVAKNYANEIGCEVALPSGLPNNLHEVFDRAHFPTVAVEEVGVAKNDISPLPIYGRNVLQQ